MNLNTLQTIPLNPKILLEMIQDLERNAELHRISILYDGEIVVEGAWNPFLLSEPQMMHSLSKTGVSICAGFAISEGKFRLTDRLCDLIPEDLPETYDPCLEKITVYDLLTMQAGSTKCCNNRWFTKLENSWTTHWLEEPRIVSDIGNVFHYDSGCSYTLSRIITKFMGKTCEELLNERIFSPMGFPWIHWLKSPDGFSTGGWGLYLTSSQIAHLGWVLLQKGRFGSRQLIPENWVEEMTKPRTPIPGTNARPLTHYGYQLKSGKDLFSAEGAFGQFMLCFRNLPLVIGITSGTPFGKIADLCHTWILKAARTPFLLDNAALAKSWEQLQEYLDSRSLPCASGDAAILPPLLENRWITLGQNARKIRRVLFLQKGSALQITFDLDGICYTGLAGYQTWMDNDLFPGDFTRVRHSLSWTSSKDTLFLSDCILNISYREDYTLRLSQENPAGPLIACTWTPNVTYLDDPRNFLGTF